jgi:hypothetical protein
MGNAPQFPRDPIRDEIDRLFQEQRDRMEQERRAAEKRNKAFLDGLAIGIALLAALFTGWQAWEAHEARKEAAQLSLESLHFSQRAYIAVDANLDDNATPVLQIRTLGNRPAVEVSLDNIECRYQAALKRNVHGAFGSRSADLGRVLAPGTVFRHSCIPEKMGKPDRYALVDGSISYKDIFGIRHSTGFCYCGTCTSLSNVGELSNGQLC